VNFFRPITLRPFPGEALREALRMSGRAMMVVESAEGQLGRMARLALEDEPLDRFETMYRPGVGITAEEIGEAVPV
jgi:2-oxoglutarate ferredoxin oxidoreductase subunit alpha